MAISVKSPPLPLVGKLFFFNKYNWQKLYLFIYTRSSSLFGGEFLLFIDCQLHCPSPLFSSFFLHGRHLLLIVSIFLIVFGVWGGGRALLSRKDGEKSVRRPF